MEMSYQSGSGTSNDPYIIATAADWIYFWGASGVGYSTAGAYFKLQNNIDCGGATVTLPSGNYFKCELDGNYHSVFNQTFSGDYLVKRSVVAGALKNIHIDANFLSGGWSNGSTGGTLSSITNVKFTIRSGAVFQNKLALLGNNAASAATKINIIFNQVGGKAISSSTDYGVYADQSVYMLSELPQSVSYPNATLLSGADRYLDSSYPSLDWSKWHITGMGSPELYSSVPVTPDANDVAIALAAVRLEWANSISKEQAWPGELCTKNLLTDTSVLCPITRARHTSSPPTLSEIGVIQGTITKKGVIAAGKRVVCLDSRFNIVAETVSGPDGKYKFGNLMRDDKYIVIAQDNWDFTYAPVGADCRTPESYS